MPDADGRHSRGDRRLGDLAGRQQTIDRVLRGHKGAGDGGGPGAAVSLDHIAIELDGALAQFFQVEHCAQRATNQPLNLLGTAGLLAAGGLAVAAAVGGAGQHAVFGSDPTFTTAAFVRRHFFFDRRGAQHLGVAELNQHRALSVHGVVAGDAHLGAVHRRRGRLGEQMVFMESILINPGRAGLAVKACGLRSGESLH